ncbi:hypothetical protein Tco_0851825 [Tanacetum coccineum]
MPRGTTQVVTRGITMISCRFSTRYVRGSDLAGSLAEGSVLGKDPEGFGRLTCHDVSGGSLAITRSRGSFLELSSHAPPAKKTEIPLVRLGL